MGEQGDLDQWFSVSWNPGLSEETSKAQGKIQGMSKSILYVLDVRTLYRIETVEMTLLLYNKFENTNLGKCFIAHFIWLC